MKKAVFAALLSAAIAMAASPGLRPRADANSYPVHQDQPGFSIGAVLVPPEQAKKMFKLDLNHAGYVVVEVGIFPGPGKSVDVNPTDFTLFIASEKLAVLRPVSADTVAEIVAGHPSAQYPSPSGPRDVNTSVGASIGHVSYPDPVTGRRTGGTVTSTEAGVGIGAPAPMPCHGYGCDTTAPYPSPSPGPSRTQTANTISQDLWEKSLPDGTTPRAVAGYLYFPKPSRKAKNTVWELRFENADGKARMPLQKPNHDAPVRRQRQ